MVLAHALLLFAVSPARAATYAYTGNAWIPAEDFPLPWYQGERQDGVLSSEYQEAILIKAFDNWVDAAPCAEISHEYMGMMEGNEGGYATDSINVMSWDDPNGEVATGVLGQTLCRSYAGEIAATIEGEQLAHTYDCDIIYNDDVAWGMTEDIEAGSCNGEYAIESVATHEVGHLWGLDHSCEDPAKGGDDCTDLDKLYATMYWSVGPCDTYQAVPKTWDVAAITSLYGPFFTFSAPEDDRSGGVPLEVCFELEGDDVVNSIEWRFGDGETSSEESPCHTYQEKGQFSVTLQVEGSSEACESFAYTHRENAYVTVCEPPQPAEGFDGMFTVEQGSGLQMQMINQADTTVYGCIDQIQWDVFKGDELVKSVQAWSPIIEFPSEGTYRVVLNLAGPGGEAAEELEIEVVEATGCSTAPGRLGLLGAALGLGLALTRRRAPVG